MQKLIYKEEPQPDVASSLINLGSACHNKEQYYQAMKYYEESLKMRKLINKDEPYPDVAYFLCYQGEAYKNKGQYDQATMYHEESLKMLTHFQGRTSSGFGLFL